MLENPLSALDGAVHERRRGCCCTAPGQSGCRWPPAWTTTSKRPAEVERGDRGDGRLGTDNLRVHPPAGAAAAHREATRLRVVQPALQLRRCATRSAAALTGARHTGLERAARRAAGSTWTSSGTAPTSGSRATRELQQAVRFGLFHVLQAGARAERPLPPAKGLTGPGLRRAHLLGHRGVRAAGAHLHPAAGRRRRAALAALHPGPGASERAATLGLRGAAFPWRTIRGQECSAYWPAGTAAFHINADIAAAVTPYRSVTGDEALETEVGLELLVETARLWMSLGHHDRRRRLAHRRGHRAGRVHRDRERQHVHQPRRRRTTCAARPTPPSATRTRPATSASPLEEVAAWRDAADAVQRPVRRPTCACTSRARGSPGCRSGTSRPPATSTRCCCTRRTSTCTAGR